MDHPRLTSPEDLLALRVRSGDGITLPEPGTSPGTPPLVPLRELVTVEQTFADKSIYHKNLMPVTYVIAEVAGVIERSYLLRIGHFSDGRRNRFHADQPRRCPRALFSGLPSNPKPQIATPSPAISFNPADADRGRGNRFG